MYRFLNLSAILVGLILLSGCISNNSPKDRKRGNSSSPDGYFESSGERWEDKNWEQQNEGEALQDWEDQIAAVGEIKLLCLRHCN